MTEIIFKKYWRYMTLPGVVWGSDEASDDHSHGTHSNVYKNSLLMLQAACEAWMEAWSAGNVLTVDESMIFWTGTGEIHVTYIPRKPTPYGIELKGVACADGRILLFVEVCEGKVADA